MNSPRVLCLGEILYDFLANQPGVPLEQVTSWTPYPGGAPANVACALTRLGTPSGFIGCVGQDQAGDALVSLLVETGVEITGVQRHSTAPTRGVYVVRSLTGDRTFAGFGNYPTTDFADAFLDPDQIPISLFELADFMVLGTLELAYPDSRAAVLRALRLCDRYYTKVFLDINWRPVFWTDPKLASGIIQDILAYADFVKCSDDEAKLLFGTTDAAVIAHRLGSVEGVLVTAGEKGCTYCIGDHTGEVPAFSIDVEDTTGAGDSFVAGFLHQLVQQGIQALEDPVTVHQIVTYASAVGALTTMRSGAIAAQPTAAEVEAFLQRKHQPS
jgi:fructokinase